MARRHTRDTHKARRERRAAGRRKEKEKMKQKHVGGTRARELEEEGGWSSRWLFSEEGDGTPRQVQYLLEAAAPDAVLPAPVRTLGVQAEGAVG